MCVRVCIYEIDEAMNKLAIQRTRNDVTVAQSVFGSVSILTLAGTGGG